MKSQKLNIKNVIPHLMRNLYNNIVPCFRRDVVWIPAFAGMTVMLFLIFNFRQVSAQVSLPLTVAPARQELTLNPGEQSAVNVKFYNLGESPVSGIVKVADFVVEGNSGTPRVIEDLSQAPPRFAGSTWFTLPYDRITIAAGDKVSLQAKINVPVNATAGGRYVAVYFEPGGTIPQAVGSPQEAGTGVASRIASLVYIKVAGDAKEAAIVSRFFAKSFYEYGPVEVTTEILNRGDYHIRPRGVVSVTNALGALAFQEKLKEQNIFPDGFRTFTTQVGQKWMLGRYRLDLAASYGEQGKALTAAAYVWVFPWRVAVVVVLALIVVYLLFRTAIEKMNTKTAVLEKEVEEEKEEI